MSSSQSYCGRCEGLAMLTPAEINNRPGLSAIAYRVGTHSQFKRSMLSALSDSQNSPLGGLSTRDDDDFSIALIDSAATVADVLSFYQERIANESYVRTATETTSLTELAFLAGYSPRPGVAASTYLAFTLEDSVGTPRKATLDIGIKVQSIPGEAEKPQIFETIEKIVARSEWNSLKAQTSKPQELTPLTTDLYFEGVDTNLHPGDALLLVADSRANYATTQDAQSLAKWDMMILQTITTNAEKNYTKASWEKADKELATLTVGEKIHAFALRQRAGLFGHNAPDPRLLNTTGTQLGDLITDGTWNDFEFEPDNPPNTIELDSVYPKILVGSWVVLKRNPSRIITLRKGNELTLHKGSDVDAVKEVNSELCQIVEVESPSVSKFALSAKISQIVPDITDELGYFGRRETVVFVQSEELIIADRPLLDPITGTSVTLSGPVDGLVKGRLVVAQGRDASTGQSIQEVVALAGVETDDADRTTLSFDPPLKKIYQLDGFSINANVAPATHGESVQELLGSGDNSQPFQRFTLRQPPLTYVASGTTTGVESSLRVYANELEWHEATMLFGHSGQDHIFSTRTDSIDRTTLQFGNGDLGARLPTGQFNLSAKYRRGIGLEGLVEKGQLSTLLTRPLGVKAVTNPTEGKGAQDPESQAEMKNNIPLRVMTLDRVVSLKDYEDFARSFAGIAKALATRTWNGHQPLVFLSVAGPNGASIEPTDPVYVNLVKALQDHGDPLASVQVQSFAKVLFRLACRVEADPDLLPEKVIVSIRTALTSKFSFEARAFGQPVALSEVIETVQSTPGVVGVTVDKLYIKDEDQKLNFLLATHLPHPNTDGSMAAAELLLLDPDPASLDQLVVTQ